MLPQATEAPALPMTVQIQIILAPLHQVPQLPPARKQTLHWPAYHTDSKPQKGQKHFTLETLHSHDSSFPDLVHQAAAELVIYKLS